jgi:hypothetical protein
MTVAQLQPVTADHSVTMASSLTAAYPSLVQGVLRLREAVLRHLGAVLLPLVEHVVGAGNAGVMLLTQLLLKQLKGSTRKRMRTIEDAISLSFALFAERILRQSTSGNAMRRLCTCHKKHGFVVIRRHQLSPGAHFVGSPCPQKNI